LFQTFSSETFSNIILAIDFEICCNDDRYDTFRDIMEVAKHFNLEDDDDIDRVTGRLFNHLDFKKISNTCSVCANNTKYDAKDWGFGASTSQILSKVDWPNETKAWIDTFSQHFPALNLTPLPGYSSFTYSFTDYKKKHRVRPHGSCEVTLSARGDTKSEAQELAAFKVFSELERLELIPGPEIVKRPIDALKGGVVRGSRKRKYGSRDN